MIMVPGNRKSNLADLGYCARVVPALAAALYHVFPSTVLLHYQIVFKLNLMTQQQHHHHHPPRLSWKNARVKIILRIITTA
jgi:hypothetical protein